MSSAVGYEFAMLKQEVTSLRGALDRAIAEDKAEADKFLTDVKRLLKHGFNYNAAATDFRNRANSLVAEAEAAMESIEASCDGPLKRNADVPRSLEVDAEKWLLNAGDVAQKVAECARQRLVEGWDGDSKIQYDAAVSVQEEALLELRGVMTSTAQSCKAGALLNRAIFCAIGEATGETRLVVQSGPAASGDSYYLRTANAVPALKALKEQITRAMTGEVADGSANVLIDEVRSTETMPNLLVKGAWPSGTAAAGVKAAPTEDGVTSEGDDANLDVEARINHCLAGANL